MALLHVIIQMLRTSLLDGQGYLREVPARKETALMHVAASLCVGMSLLLGGCSAVHQYYVEHAYMIPFSEVDQGPLAASRPGPTKLLLNGHYVRAGTKLVLLIRRFDKGNLFAIDDETYEKLSIEVGSYTIGAPISFDASAIRLYYQGPAEDHGRKPVGESAPLAGV